MFEFNDYGDDNRAFAHSAGVEKLFLLSLDLINCDNKPELLTYTNLNCSGDNNKSFALRDIL
jgi:hypothetical protein